MTEYVQLKDTPFGASLAKLRVAIQQEIIPAVAKKIEELTKQAEHLVKMAELAKTMQPSKESETPNPSSK